MIFLPLWRDSDATEVLGSCIGQLRRRTGGDVSRVGATREGR